MRNIDAKDLRKTAKELKLIGYTKLFITSDEKIERVCNGIGPYFFPGIIRKLIDRLNPSLIYAAALHDLAYYDGKGTEKDFFNANSALRTNGILLADHNYKWYDPRRYYVRRQARKFAMLCDSFGWLAYKNAIKEREDWKKGISNRRVEK
jgi:hypothetical protein